jgi:hypothetical protein
MFDNNLWNKVKRFFAEYAGRFELVPFKMAPADNKSRMEKKEGTQIKCI